MTPLQDSAPALRWLRLHDRRPLTLSRCSCRRAPADEGEFQEQEVLGHRIVIGHVVAPVIGSTV